MKNTKLLGLSLALLIGVGAITTGCSQQAEMPNTPSVNSGTNSTTVTPNTSTSQASNPNTSTPVASANPGNTVATTPSSTTPASTVPTQTSSAKPSTTTTTAAAQTASKTDAKDAMIAYNDDESTFSDSESVASDSFAAKSFSTMALGDKIQTTIATSTSASGTTTTKTTVRAKVRKELTDSGAVAVNADGTLTVDPVKLTAEKDKLRTKLKAVKEVLKEKLQKLRRKNNIARTSDVDTVDNGDGTTTKTTTVNFTNDKLKISRDNVFSKTTTTADGKLVSSEHSLKVTDNGYSRISTRVITVDATTGAKKVVTDSTTTWKNGRTRVLHEERNLDATGNGTGTGTIKVTTKDGKVTTYNLNSKITASIAVSATASDPATNTEVKVEPKEDGSATQTVMTDGKVEATETVTADAADNAIAADASVEATATTSAT